MNGRPNRRNKAAFCDGLVWTVRLTGNKVAFSRRISVDGRASRRNKAALSNFLGALWTLLYLLAVCRQK